MSLTTTEVFGFADAVSEAMTSNQADLLTKGVTVAPWVTEITTLKSAAVTKNQQQETLKAQQKEDLKAKTAEVDAALQATYDFASSKLDVLAGAYGKTSEKGKALLKLRSAIRRDSKAAKPTPPTT